MKIKTIAVVTALAAALALGACGGETGNSGASSVISGSVAGSSAEASVTAGSDQSAVPSVSADSARAAAENAEIYVTDDLSGAPEVSGLTCEKKLNLQYAQDFAVYYYNDDYKLISIKDGGNYLLVPEGKEAPDGISDDLVVVQAPPKNIYMAASGSMCFFSALDCMDSVTMTAIDKDGWEIQAPIDAMNAGTLTYAGKYSEPDYEMLLSKECGLAIESTMILHAPKVQEMIEDLGIPVLIDRCSYETDPLGRMEWVKMYGALMGKEEAAFKYFAGELTSLGDYENFEDTGKTVGFFSINSNNQVTVRKTDDIIPNMIKMAGGNYIFEDLENPTSNSVSVNLSMEKFYADAKDADYLIYNSIIETPLSSLSDLTGKNELFKQFKAVQNGNVWQVDKTWYQSTDRVGELLTDIHTMLTGGDASAMKFLQKVQ
jgi:iron complex transport system substrate-binding protein